MERVVAGRQLRDDRNSRVPDPRPAKHYGQGRLATGFKVRALVVGYWVTLAPVMFVVALVTLWRLR